jgi:hypothetical protein
MVFFIYMGGGWQGLGLSLAIFAASVAMNGNLGLLLPSLFGGSYQRHQHYSDGGALHEEDLRGGDHRYGHAPSQPTGGNDHGWRGLPAGGGWLPQAVMAVGLLVGLAAVVCGLALRHPDLAGHWAMVRLRGAMLQAQGAVRRPP